MNLLVQYEQNLIKNGFASFYGGFAQQTPQAFVSINRLLNAHNFDTIIEIGSHTFGLSMMLALYCRLSKVPASCTNPQEPSLFVNRTHHRSPKQFVTYDLHLRDQSARDVVMTLGGRFIQANTLTDEKMIDSIHSLIQDPKSGTVLLLCDGGNKKKELDLYGPALKQGDFVMLHDWAKDQATFEQNKRDGIWHCWETRMENGPDPLHDQFGIKELLVRDGIQQVYADEFDKVAWFVGIKS